MTAAMGCVGAELGARTAEGSGGWNLPGRLPGEGEACGFLASLEPPGSL